MAFAAWIQTTFSGKYGLARVIQLYRSFLEHSLKLDDQILSKTLYTCDGLCKASEITQIKAASSVEWAVAPLQILGGATVVVSLLEAGSSPSVVTGGRSKWLQIFVTIGQCLNKINITSCVHYVALDNTH